MALPLTTDLVGLLDSPIVDLYVGKKRKKFSVHQKLICNRSTFFRKAFNGPFKEGTDGAVYLSEDDPAVVERFIAWLYSGIIHSPPAKSSGSAKDNNHKDTDGSAMNSNSDSSDNNGSTEAFLAFQSKFYYYAQLYFFAEKYGIESLQNQAIDKLPTLMSGHYHTADGLQEVYENTAPSSPLRKFVVSRLAYYLMLRSSKPDRGSITQYCEIGGDFVADLLMECWALKPKGIKSPSAKPSCDYHVHSDGKRCG